MKQTSFVLLFIVLAFSQALAEEDVVWKELFKAKCLKCQYGNGSVANWKSKQLKIEMDNFNATIFFCSINLQKETAKMVGNQGSADIMVMATPQGIHFIETTRAGNLSFVTVFAEYAKDTTDYITVISRHINQPTATLPSQYHGTCKIWE